MEFSGYAGQESMDSTTFGTDTIIGAIIPFAQVEFEEDWFEVDEYLEMKFYNWDKKFPNQYDSGKHAALLFQLEQDKKAGIIDYKIDTTQPTGFETLYIRYPRKDPAMQIVNEI